MLNCLQGVCFTCSNTKDKNYYARKPRIWVLILVFHFQVSGSEEHTFLISQCLWVRNTSTAYLICCSKYYRWAMVLSGTPWEKLLSFLRLLAELRSLRFENGGLCFLLVLQQILLSAPKCAGSFWPLGTPSPQALTAYLCKPAREYQQMHEWIDLDIESQK